MKPDNPLEQVQGWSGHWLAPGAAHEDETKALSDGPREGMVRVRMVASAEGEDSVGDVMTASALTDMVRDLTKGVAVVADHAQLMKDVMGKTVFGRIEGKRVIATVDLDSEHPVTAMVLRHIELGIPTGPSIRFRIPANGAKYLRESNGLEIHRVTLHSLDPVAIPAVSQARGSMEVLKSYLASQSPELVPEEATMELSPENLKAMTEAVASLRETLDVLKQEQTAVKGQLADVLKALEALKPEPAAEVEVVIEADALKSLPEDEQKALLDFRMKRDAGTNNRAAFEPTPEVEVDPNAPITLTPEERQKAINRLRGVEVVA